MRNVRFLVAYDGSRFFGWQRQDGFETIQQELEEAFEALAGSAVVVHGAGRTDTGVHARAQVANAHVDTRLDDHQLVHALNAHLPVGITVRRLETCSSDFHARFAARGKRYAYFLSTDSTRPPFAPELCHWMRVPLDLEAMRQAALAFTGTQDFSALASAGSPRHDNVRTLRPVRLVVRRRMLGFVVQGNGFLYNMVRTLAGTLLEVGRGRMAPERVAEILASRDRRLAGPTAPAAGLWLLRVLYDPPCLTAPLVGPRGAAGVFQDYPGSEKRRL